MNPENPSKRRRTGMNAYESTYNDDNDNKDCFYQVSSIQDLINIAKSLKRRRNADFSRLKALLPELERLNNMIGMEKLKKSITFQILYYLQDLGSNDMLHTVIEGPPGCGKTVVAEILAKIYLKLSFLDNDIFKVAKRSDLIGEYLGQTAAKTQKLINKCQGGVLFIDEAYSLGNKEGRDSYSKECIDTIVSNLAEKRRFVCIIAGYKKDLEQCFFSVNAGLRRRFPWIYTIEEYTPKELSEIFEKQVGDASWYISQKAREKLPSFFNERKKYFPHFGGDTETLFAKVKISHSRRVFGKPRYMKKEINFVDMKKGYELFLENSHVKQGEGKNLPPPGMYC
jgi:replication-associated recombination protein RarA